MVPVAVGDFRHIQNEFHMCHFQQVENIVEVIAFQLFNQRNETGCFVSIDTHNGIFCSVLLFFVILCRAEFFGKVGEIWGGISQPAVVKYNLYGCK